MAAAIAQPAFAVDDESVVYDGRTLRFDIIGVPLAMPRPRVNFNTRAIYNPRRAALMHQRAVLTAALQGFSLGNAPVAVSLVFAVPRPRFHFRTRHGMPAGLFAHFSDPLACRTADTDNYVKWILDAMSGIIYDDDIQVVAIKAVRVYEDEFGATGRTMVRIDRVADNRQMIMNWVYTL